MRITRVAFLGAIALALGCSDQPLEPIEDQPLFKQALVEGELEGTFVLGETLDMGRVWLTDNTVRHMKDLTYVVQYSGDIVGEAHVVQHSNFNMKKLMGYVGGTIEIDVEYLEGWEGDPDGTFEGKLALNMKEWWVVGSYILHGTGDLEGLKIEMSHEGSPGPVGTSFTWSARFIGSGM
jgi:hypothetical protein